MKKPVKLQDVQTATFWNSTHKLTLIFQPLNDVTEPPIDPPVEPITPNIPTGIKLSEYDIASLNAVTGIKLTEYKT